jgi:hypothetical protein
LKLYFDTTTWVRLFETGNPKIDAERTAIQRICEQNMEIITSQFQLAQMYSKKNSRSIPPEENELFAKAISVCEFRATTPPKFDPYYGSILREFSDKTNLQHREDKIHLILAWLNEADFFITTDGELYNTEKLSIEVVLAGMVHPHAQGNFHKMTVLNPTDLSLP